MKFSVRVSPLMEKWNSPLGSIEDRLIRVPGILREEFGLSPGLFLCLKDKSGNSVPLQVSIAYRKDLEEDDKCVYVSQDTYNLLGVEKISGIKPADDILIGCDPEFFLIDGNTGVRISASHFFPHYGDVGSDCGLAELRPRPSLKESELSSNIYELMKKAFHHLNDRGLFRKRIINMIAASHWDEAAAGYHVHFGLPQFLLRGSPQTHIFLAYMVNILDYYVGIPAILPEGSEDFRRRSARYSRYGKPGDYRADDAMTLEYRVPGGHLLRHPILSSGVLAISIVVMKDMLSRLRVYTDNFTKPSPFKCYDDLRFLYPSLPNRQIVYDCIVSENTRNALIQAGTILKDISSMIGYKENESAIIRYFEYVLSYMYKNEKFSESIETNWRLAQNEKQPREMAVLQPSS
jgi:hypothetical protein